MLYKLGYWLLGAGLCAAAAGPFILLADGASFFLLADSFSKLRRA